MHTAALKQEEEVVPQKEAKVVDLVTGFQPLPKLVSDHEGNQYCPETGQILFCHRISKNRNLLYDTF